MPKPTVIVVDGVNQIRISSWTVRRLKLWKEHCLNILMIFKYGIEIMQAKIHEKYPVSSLKCYKSNTLKWLTSDFKQKVQVRHSKDRNESGTKLNSILG